MKKIKITHHFESSWYRTGEVYSVKDEKRYEGIGVQVVKENNGYTPDVVRDGDYEYVE